MDVLGWLAAESWRYHLVAWSALAILVGTALLPELLRHRPRHSLTWDWWFAAMVPVAILASRWPLLFEPRHLNPDESFFLSSAITLWHDPVYGRSVVGGTSGPLNLYPLFLLRLVGGDFDYPEARLLAMALHSATVWALAAAARPLLPPGGARILLLPLVFFLARPGHTDFSHYSSETVPMALLALLAWRVVRLERREGAPGVPEGIALGALAGAIPFAKLQAGPIACGLGLAALWLVGRNSQGSRRWLGIGALGAGALLPLAGFLLQAWWFGTWEHLQRSYLSANLGYADLRMSLMDSLVNLPRWLSVAPNFAAFLLLALVAGMGGALLGWCRRIESGLRPQSPPWLLATAAATLVLAVWAVLLPGRYYAHYFLLLVVPAFLWAAAGAGILYETGPAPTTRVPRRLPRLALGLWIAATFQTGLLSSNDSAIRALDRVGTREPAWLPQTVFLRKHGLQDRGVGLWGWMYELTVENRLWRASRDNVIEHASEHPRVDQTDWRELVDPYFTRCYLADFQARRPDLFLDAVAPAAWAFRDRTRFGHETFPELAAAVATDYLEVADIEGVRIYLRRDLAASRGGNSPADPAPGTDETAFLP